MVGSRFGLWTVLSREKARGYGYWLCRCDCGTERMVYGQNMKRGLSASCGCRIPALTATRSYRHGDAPRRKMASEYGTYKAMIARCHSPRATAYPDYGARGIFVCQRWRGSYAAFLADMGRRPSPQHTLDRQDNNGPYNPDNCRWVTRTVQAENRRSSIWITIGGETMVMQRWCERTGVCPKLASQRIRRGWTPERAVTAGPDLTSRFAARAR